MLEEFAKQSTNETFSGTWNAVSGVTEGAFNAYLISLHENENSTTAIKTTAKSLTDFWVKLGTSPVYQQHTFGLLEGIVFRDGIYRADPLMKLIDAEFGSGDLHQKNSKRALNIGIANLMNGTFVSFNDNFKTRDLLKALKASVVYPGIFAPYEAWNTTWLTGSSIWKIDVAAPILRCKNMGYLEEDIIIDAVIDDATELAKVNVSNYNAFEMGLRSYEVMNYYSARQALLNAQIAYPSVMFRHVVGPKRSWTEKTMDQAYKWMFHWVPIAYSKSDVGVQMKKGYNDARTEMTSRVSEGSYQYFVDVKDTFYRGGEEEL